MSLLSENIIPGNYGKVFETDATEHDQLEKIKLSILKLEGVKEVFVNEDDFPKKLTIHTSKIVDIEDVENAVKKIGFHVIPKSTFPL